MLHAGATDDSSHDRVMLGTAYSLPRRFDLRAEPADPTRPRVQIWWEVVDGTPVCVGVLVKPGPAAALTTAGLRVPVARYLREAVETVALHVDTGRPVWFADAEKYAGDVAATLQQLAQVKPSRGVPVPDSRLRRTAELWHEALAVGRSRTDHICREQHVSKPTADRYVRRARALGLIPPRT